MSLFFAPSAPSPGLSARPSQLDTLRDALGARRTSGTSASAAAAGGAGPTVLVCASGRGGSGTSVVAALLALAAAGEGHRTLLIDADELFGPQALLLAATPRGRWTSLRSGAVDASTIGTVISDTLTLVAGGTADDLADQPALTSAERRACLRRLRPLAQQHALVVIDAGSRLDTVLAALDAGQSPAHLLAVVGASDPIAHAATYALLKAVSARQPSCLASLITTRLDDAESARLSNTLNAGSQQFLARAFPLAGSLPYDAALSTALSRGLPLLEAVAGSAVALAALDLALRLHSSAITSGTGA